MSSDQPVRLALKVDVDTDRGTAVGVPQLLEDLRAAGLEGRACFLFSLGPDQTGRAVSRVFRPGFLQKVGRTSVVSIYGVRTLLNGTVLPAPHIGRRHAAIMREVRNTGYEVGIHCYNHYLWQDHVQRMTLDEIRAEFARAREEFHRIFGFEALSAGAAGWQSNERSRTVYDEAELLYSSDTRGGRPFWPRIGGRRFRTLEIPSTLPTLDELMGRPEFPDGEIVPHLLSLLRPDTLNVFTLHAEIEGMARRCLFQQLLRDANARGVEFVRLEDEARLLFKQADQVPEAEQTLAPIDGRSGLVATQTAISADQSAEIAVPR